MNRVSSVPLLPTYARPRANTIFRRELPTPFDNANTKCLSSARIAIVHDWLPLYGGAERVLEQIIHLFPNAELFSIIDKIPEGKRGFLQNKHVNTSVIQRLPGGKRWYRHYLPIMPMAIE